MGRAFIPEGNGYAPEPKSVTVSDFINTSHQVNLVKTRHLYTFQDGDVIVLEHIVAIKTCYSNREEGLFFQVDMIGDVCYCHADVEIEETVYGHLKFDGTQEAVTYTTTERAKLIKALAEI